MLFVAFSAYAQPAQSSVLARSQHYELVCRPEKDATESIAVELIDLRNGRIAPIRNIREIADKCVLLEGERSVFISIAESTNLDTLLTLDVANHRLQRIDSSLGWSFVSGCVVRGDIVVLVDKYAGSATRRRMRSYMAVVSKQVSIHPIAASAKWNIFSDQRQSEHMLVRYELDKIRAIRISRVPVWNSEKRVWTMRSAGGRIIVLR